MEKVVVTFMPADEAIEAKRGDNLLEAAIEAGVHINAACGGEGACGKCRVFIQAGEVEYKGSAKISQEDFEKGIFLAVNHRGAPDHIGAVTGSLLGVQGGAAAIPSRFVKPLELRALILEMATDLYNLGQI